MIFFKMSMGTTTVIIRSKTPRQWLPWAMGLSEPSSRLVCSVKWLKTLAYNDVFYTRSSPIGCTGYLDHQEMIYEACPSKDLAIFAEIQFPLFQLDCSQPPLSPAPENRCSLLNSTGINTYVHIQTIKHININNNKSRKEWR